MTFQHQIRWASLFGTLSVAVVLSGCGGGGKGGMTTMTTPTQTTPTQTSPTQTTPTPPPSSIAGAVRNAGERGLTGVGKAARSTPKAGSVMQSSHTNADGVTRDTISVTAGYDAQRQVTFSGTYDDGSGGDPEIRIGTANDLVERVPGSQICERCPTKPDGTASNWQTALLFQRVTDGYLAVFAASDIEDADDTDYMAGGVWLHVPSSASSVDDVTFGAFVDASDPFTSQNVQRLTGTARYQGDASGIYTVKASRDASGTIGLFDADVELTANFGNVSELGTVSGRVFNPRLDTGETSILEEVSMREAPITDTEGGFFRGDTSGTDSTGGGYSGKWGGQFVGNTSGDPNAHPTSVGGTFGASREDDLVNFVGAFGAYKQ